MIASQIFSIYRLLGGALPEPPCARLHSSMSISVLFFPYPAARPVIPSPKFPDPSGPGEDPPRGAALGGQDPGVRCFDFGAGHVPTDRGRCTANRAAAANRVPVTVPGFGGGFRRAAEDDGGVLQEASWRVETCEKEP